jgi:bifunctional DNA-binding transcriptional regulator/antitoxin component of YhaV-PrlF toxin-antitoxin module
MHIVEIKQDIDNELYIEIPEELINELGWTTETELEWIIEEGKVILKKKEEQKEV